MAPAVTTRSRAPAVRRSAALLTLSALVLPAEAQPPATFPVEAPIVHVEVTVTDMRGRPVKAGQWILAEQTGGSAVFDANDPGAALRQLAGQIRGHYSLSFTPDHPSDGRIHGLRVELRKKGLRLRHTPSYFHGPRAEPGASRTLAALLAGLEEDTLGAEVSIDVPPVSDSLPVALRMANLRISVPAARLTAVEGAEGGHGRLRVVIAVWRAGAAAKEQPLEVREKLIDVPLPAAVPAAGSDPERREFVVEVPLGAGREIAVGVHDTFSRLVTYRRVRAAAPGDG